MTTTTTTTGPMTTATSLGGVLASRSFGIPRAEHFRIVESPVPAPV